jgi:16S rRNA (cytosine967-C5)-methyltransferase
MSDVRACAAQVLYQVMVEGMSLNQALPAAYPKIADKDKALLQQLCYGVLRNLSSLEFYCSKLLSKPLKGKQKLFEYLLYVGIYQLQHMRTPPHAAVAETVNALTTLNATGLKGLINAVLRNFQRQQVDLETQAAQINACRYNHPGWFINQLKTAYPDQWQAILEANQIQAPMWLRVNQSQHSTQAYSEQLDNENIAHQQPEKFIDAILLDKPKDVFELPGFTEGSSSVQDGAAQMAARLLDPQDGDYILDACAAPGGKTCHLLELAKVDVVALDSDATRLERVQENLDRIALNAKLLCADASKPDDWFDGKQFDRILLDVPCSATGVIRRHPDIKWLRRADDIGKLAKLQSEILNQIWPLLKSGGTLLYATCSVLPQENKDQMIKFLASHPDAQHIALHSDDTPATPGWQLLPDQTDGFYYAKLTKQ